jgi:endonuclease G
VHRAHADTFHVTNRAPQVGFFNMGMFKPAEEAGHAGGILHWRALEDFVLNNARADRKRVTVFTGPIFDDENDIPWSRGREDMEGFMAPLEYWKLLLRVEGGELHATAFIADQSPLIDFVPEMMEVSAEAANRIAFEKVARYHVSVAELSTRTGLDFGADVLAADTFIPGPGEESNRRQVRTIAELSFDRRSNGNSATTMAARRRDNPKKRS